MMATYQIIEYGSFVRGKDMTGYTSLPEDTFDTLENFILSNRSRDTDALELMGLSARKGIGRIITAKNYVGVISMNDGTTIEILPKVYSSENYTETQVKKLLIEMLKTLHDSPYKTLQTSNVNIEKMSIFEVFIRMFLDEVFLIVKRGLKCNYENIQDNERIFKGKLLFQRHIKENFAHKERSFVEYDEFNQNRAENRLLKSTLLYLYRQSTSAKNKTDIKTLLNAFSDIDVSMDYEGDYSKYNPERNTKDYATAMLWSRVFLMGKSFTSFYGSEIAYALLFPMETLFESYIAAQLKNVLGTSDFSISAQDKKYHLFDLPNKKFLIKPDIVVRRKSDEIIFLLDTKWKLLSDAIPNLGISQADMYQMYAYQKKYDNGNGTVQNVTLLYPMMNKISKGKEIRYESVDGVTVNVKFIDLFNVKASILGIFSQIGAVK